MSRGRPPIPFIKRIARHIAISEHLIEGIFSRYPDPEGGALSAHWIWLGAVSHPDKYQPREAPIPVMSYGNSVSTVPRAILNELRPEKLKPYERVRVTCGYPRCVNPEHMIVLLPKGWGSSATEELGADEEMLELVGLIMSHEPRETPDQFKARAAKAHLKWSDDLIAKAFKHIEEHE